MIRIPSIALLGALALACGVAVADQSAGAIKAEVTKTSAGFQLLRDGKPYFIQGAGGGSPKPLLAQVGGNSFRTWGADDVGAQLDEAQKLGLTVTVGIWMRHEGDKGFSYGDTTAVAQQLEKAKAAVARYKNHPALLMWAVGNEMEGYKAGDNPLIWKAVEEVAAMIKKADPNHPTMTVIAELGGKRVESINALCPNIDVVGINSYGGVSSVGERYKKLGATKPYVITEFGPPGTWEGRKTKFGAPIEFNSTEKGKIYRSGYEKGVLAEKDFCLGSYAFTWGFKQEATATWYGMLLSDGSQLEAVHTMAQLWSGRAPADHCPQIKTPKLAEGDEGKVGATVHATVDVSDPDGDPLKVEWVLRGETMKVAAAGQGDPAPPNYPAAIVHGGDHDAEIKLPDKPGVYRLFVYAHDGHGNAATANVPLHVTE